MAAYWNDDNFQWTTTDIYTNVLYTPYSFSRCKLYLFTVITSQFNIFLFFIYLLFCCNHIKVFFLFSMWITIFFACNNFIRNFFFCLFVQNQVENGWVCYVSFIKIISNQLNCLLILICKRYQVFLFSVFFCN